jgi:hypothetical protein
MGRPAPEHADPETLHRVYSAQLPGLSLSAAHRDALRRRGLSDAEIDRQGVAFDKGAWHSLARRAGDEAAALRGELDRTAPAKPCGLFGGRWNWDSPLQVKEVLGLSGCEVGDTGDDTLAAVNHPLAALVRRYRDAQKRCTTYGADWR